MNSKTILRNTITLGQIYHYLPIYSMANLNSLPLYERIQRKMLYKVKELVEELVWLLYQSRIKAIIYSVQGTLV
jgi:hypothetical protein